MIVLYDYGLSGNCYKVRLLLDWLELDYRTVPIDFYPGFEHKSDAFLQINPLGQLPVLEDQGRTIRDAQAILVHCAATYDVDGHWYPLHAPERLGDIQSWLAFADSLTATCSAARLHDAMFYDFDIEKLRSAAKKLLRVLDEHIWFQERRGQHWLCDGDEPTIADIACFPYTALAEEGGISLLPFTALKRWHARFRKLDGFSPMPGIAPSLSSTAQLL